MFWLNIISNFFKVMRAGQTPTQIAAGFALGAIIGLSPMFTLQGIAVWLIILTLDVNLSAATLALALFSAFAYIFDPLFHRLGYFLLVDVDSLKSLWTTLYNAPIAPLSRFNNTVVLGSFVGAIVLTVPVFVGMKRLVVAYRAHLHTRVEKWKLYQLISKSSFYGWYQRVSKMGVI
ncbi:MAG: TIGR03546 family protein [Ignavibacteriales bacterium]|nr:TIGR03546 family protein [Ignavibacteriales bacterium]